MLKRSSKCSPAIVYFDKQIGELAAPSTRAANIAAGIEKLATLSEEDIKFYADEMKRYKRTLPVEDIHTPSALQVIFDDDEIVLSAEERIKTALQLHKLQVCYELELALFIQLQSLKSGISYTPRSRELSAPDMVALIVSAALRNSDRDKEMFSQLKTLLLELEEIV